MTSEAQSTTWIQTDSLYALQSDLKSLNIEKRNLQAKSDILEHQKVTLIRDLEEEISNSLDSKAELEIALNKLTNVETNCETK